MATIGVNFDLNHYPNPIALNLSVRLNNKTLSIVPVDIPRISVTATPRFSGSIVDSIISTVITPVANIVTGSLGMFASEIFGGKSFDVFDVPDMSFNVPGMTVTIKPSHLSTDNFNGMLMISGDVDIV